MSSSPTHDQPLKVKAWHVVFLCVVIAATLALAWWQWTRFQSGSGTFQNLGYALQWPFFGAFFVYAYRRILRYENDKRQFEAAEGNGAYTAPEIAAASGADFAAGILPQREQLTVEEFNRRHRPTRRRHHTDESQ